MYERRQSWLFDADRQGGHYHVTIRCGMKDEARALAGRITVTEDEWPVLKRMLLNGHWHHEDDRHVAVEVRDDEGVTFQGEKWADAVQRG